MKKFIFSIISLLFFIPNVYADKAIPNGIPPEEKIPAELIRCDSVSNVWLKFNDEVKRVKLLAFDSEDGSLNNEIDEYFCKLLKEGNKIEVEYDIEPTDQYNRELVYIYVNDLLVQEDLLSKGYGQVNNVQGNYKYLDQMCDIQKESIINNLGIWKYPNIEERYCNSGIEIGNNVSNQTVVKEENNNQDHQELINMVFINSGILFLLILLKRKI